MPQLIASRTSSSKVRLCASSDAMLWEKFRDGDKEALSALYNRHFQFLYQHGVFFCRDRDLVLDCLQDLFSGLWHSRSRISNAQSVKEYLLKSFQRMLLAQIVRGRKLRTNVPDAGDQSASFEDALIEHEARQERLHLVQEGLKTLSKGQREVILLKFFNDLSYPEISEVMDLHVNSVYNLTSKAIEHLRRELQYEHLVYSGL